MVRLSSRLSSAQVEALEAAVVAAKSAAGAGTGDDELLRFVRDLSAVRSRGRRVPDRATDEFALALARMILDGLLEARGEGPFASGVRAIGSIWVSQQEMLAGARSNPATRLARQALESVHVVAARGPTAVAARLYMHGRRPVTPEVCRSLPTPAHVLRLLDMDAGSPRARRVARAWAMAPLPQSTDDWIAWRAVSDRGHWENAAITWKLYVCPTREAFRAAFEPSVDCFACCGASQFKIGAGAFALARPDKFVAYFGSRDALVRCIKSLEPLLAKCESHPVPFAAGASSSGIVAWGVDFAFELAHDEQVSWRWWICERLARYLCDATSQGASESAAVDYALLRLSLDDVSIETFAPSDRLLLEVAASATQVPRD